MVLRSTTPCVVVSSFNRADLLTLNSIVWLSSRTVPVADIYTFLREPDPLLRTLLVFRSGRKPYERDYVVGSVEIGGKLLTWQFVLSPGQRRRRDNPQLQLQQQRMVLCVLSCSLKINLSLVVMMSPVNPWKAEPTSALSTGCGKNILCMQCGYLGYFLQNHQRSRLAVFFILNIQQNIRAISKASAQRWV